MSDYINNNVFIKIILHLVLTRLLLDDNTKSDQEQHSLIQKLINY